MCHCEDTPFGRPGDTYPVNKVFKLFLCNFHARRQEQINNRSAMSYYETASSTQASYISSAAGPHNTPFGNNDAG